jgi:2-aminobenzoate-CoA ligase
MTISGHVDSFTRDHLPPREEMPEFRFAQADLNYPERLNCVAELLDRWVAAGKGDQPCLITPSETLTYASLQERVNRMANVLTRDLGLATGNRVLLRGPNNAMMAAAWLAVIKAGGVTVATMPLLRARELAYPIRKAKIALALCDARLGEDLEKAKEQANDLERIVYWGSDRADDLTRLMSKPGYEHFGAAETAADDVCLIAFTSGTTGEPKGTMHFHRDMLATCDTYGRNVLRPAASDRFIGSAPLAFTYGLGGHLLFPMRVGASSILIERAPPDELFAAVGTYRATICFTAPTAYRAILPKLASHDISSLKKCVSAGETLPKVTFEAWHKATGLRIMDGLGSTEMLHIFIGSPAEEMHAGATGRVVPGYEARVVDEAGRELPPGTVGRLSVRGPTGCRYLADARQRKYVEVGWNMPGDTYMMDTAGYFYYQARSDDMIISAGYNIAGPEVEAALLTHPAVAECGVVGAPDPDRGMIVKAYVVLRPDRAGDAALTKLLQDYVKEQIAPFKYPRAIEYVTELPKTPTGKLQRFELRRMAAASAGQKLAS